MLLPFFVCAACSTDSSTSIDAGAKQPDALIVDGSTTDILGDGPARDSVATDGGADQQVEQTGSPAWTTFTPSADTMIVYVSNSLGDDSTCDSYAASAVDDVFQPSDAFTPCKTIGKAASIFNALPNGAPHWILFKSGDTWTNESFGKWEKSGRSAAEPALLASYGDSSERPRVLTGTDGFSAAVSAGVEFVTIADLHIDAHTYASDGSTGPRAFRWITEVAGGDWVFEGLHVQNFQTAFLIGASQDPYRGKISNLTFRNNVVNGNQGENALYISGVNGAQLFEGNTFYDNAYLPGHEDGAYRGKHIYFDNENGYPPFDPTGSAIFRENIFVDSTAYAFHARTGGEIENNYVEGHGLGIVVGGHDGGQTWDLVTTSVHHNVVMHLVDSLHQELGYGILLENSDADVEYNIIAYYGSAKDYGHPFQVSGEAGNTTTARLVRNTIYSTVGDIRKIDDVAPIVQSDNLINDDMELLSTNSLSSAVSFVDAELRDLAKYNMEVLGGPRETKAFMLEALKQWRGNFSGAYTANAVNEYIRRGFEPDGSQPEMCAKGAVPCGYGSGADN
ncbi:MAG: right-handed parallel beta-helix repeat-containing protein [Deltaproteobacteria bacterium]|nr:right-handed parallel beta-helix repeat-containing protein [Deltaproteobacteria bacterium]